MITDQELKRFEELDKRIKNLGAKILKTEEDLDMLRKNRDVGRTMLAAYPNDWCAKGLLEETEAEIKVKCFYLVDARKEYDDGIIRLADFMRRLESE